MEYPQTYNQCRFCLKLVEELSSYSIFSEEGQHSHLYEFVQQMLSIKFTVENSYVCADCFTVWQMIRDFVQACQIANQIMDVSTTVTVRKSWLEGDEDSRMLIALCRRVKKFGHEMDVLLRTVQRASKDVIVHGKMNGTRTPVMYGRRQPPKVAQGKPIENELDNLKQEEEVEIDDSEAFQTSDPIEARRINPTEEVSVRMNVVETKNDPPGSKADESIDDSVTIVEPQVDQIDLIDSSDEDDEEEDEFYEIEENYSDEDNLNPRPKKIFDENLLKTVCQLCGATTNDMANHLESHISEPTMFVRKGPNSTEPVLLESDSSRSSSSKSNMRTKKRQKKTTKKPPDADNGSLKCHVCGMEFVSELASRLHARLHPFNRVGNNRIQGVRKSKTVARTAV